MKHTTGPWEVNNKLTTPPGMIAISSTQVPEIVCYVGSANKDYGDKPIRNSESYIIIDSTDKANVRLVTAAPDLLEALEQLVEELPSKGTVTQLTLRDAHEAITKAKGE